MQSLLLPNALGVHLALLVWSRLADAAAAAADVKGSVEFALLALGNLLAANVDALSVVLRRVRLNFEAKKPSSRFWQAHDGSDWLDNGQNRSNIFQLDPTKTSREILLLS